MDEVAHVESLMRRYLYLPTDMLPNDLHKEALIVLTLAKQGFSRETIKLKVADTQISRENRYLDIVACGQFADAVLNLVKMPETRPTIDEIAQVEKLLTSFLSLDGMPFEDLRNESTALLILARHGYTRELKAKLALAQVVRQGHFSEFEVSRVLAEAILEIAAPIRDGRR